MVLPPPPPRMIFICVSRMWWVCWQWHLEPMMFSLMIWRNYCSGIDPGNQAMPPCRRWLFCSNPLAKVFRLCLVLLLRIRVSVYYPRVLSLPMCPPWAWQWVARQNWEFVKSNKKCSCCFVLSHDVLTQDRAEQSLFNATLQWEFCWTRTCPSMGKLNLLDKWSGWKVM